MSDAQVGDDAGGMGCVCSRDVVQRRHRRDAPVAGFGMLSGRTVLILPVQYVQRVPGGWVGGASNEREAARQADTELTFALSERGGRAVWVTPDQQVATLKRWPSIEGTLMRCRPSKCAGRDRTWRM